MEWYEREDEVGAKRPPDCRRDVGLGDHQIGSTPPHGWCSH